ncbi:MAG: hypothetical protein ACUVV6_03140 [Thermoplasmatota archaeon]
MRSSVLVAAVVAVVIAAVALALVLLPRAGREGGGETGGPKLTVNGKAWEWAGLEKLERRTVSGTEGVSLSAIVNASGVGDPAAHQYRLLASDGYSKNVTWDDMVEGAVARVVEGGNATLKSMFPSLPKRYSVRGLVEIQLIETATLRVCGRTYTWEQPFDTMLEPASIGGLEGVRLSDLVNHTGLANPASLNYTLRAGDGHNKTVNWSSMCSGLLLVEDHGTFFESLPKAYQVKDLVEIEASPAE